jgi:hypothetical protein
MPIARLLNGSSFSPDEVIALSAIFDDTLQTLGIERSAPFAETIAKTIFSLARQGESDPVRLRESALKSITA